MRKRVAATLLATLMAGTSALAQEFQLPPGSPSPASPAAGPTDSNAPAPRPTPTPTPTPAPTTATAPLPSTTPAPSASASPSPRATPRARPTDLARPTPAASESPAAEATDEPSLGEGAPVLNGGPSAVPTEPAAPVATSAPNPEWLLWAALAAGGVLLSVISFLLGRRSARAAPVYIEPEMEPLVLTEELLPPPPAPKTKAKRKAKAETETAPVAEPPPPMIDIPAPEPEFAVEPEAEPLPLPAFASRIDSTPFDIELVPQRMTMALINASLSYRLTILNRDARPLGPLRISCDLISAHASLQTAEQLEPDPEKAWMSHDFEVLPPGEHLLVDGEVRLPRAEILPVRSGSSQLFVPLIRFTVQTLAGSEPETIGARVFVIGEEPDQAGGGLKPFRLNDGTRSYSRIGQREVTIAP